MKAFGPVLEFAWGKAILALFIAIFMFLIFPSCRQSMPEFVMHIPMRDGTRLSTSILLPGKQNEKYPLVLIRTPYKKENRIAEYRYLTENGYAIAVQDVRGRFSSQGDFNPFTKESEDGFDTINWLARQEWCNGNIGMIGSSYNGFVQYSAAIEQPPALKTIIPNVAMVDPFEAGIYVNGIFLPNSLLWCAILEDRESTEEIQRKNWGRLLDHTPISELDFLIFSKKIDYFQQWTNHDLKDSFWRQDSHFEKLSLIQIPVFIQTGWFDSQMQGNIRAYQELRNSGNRNIKLIVGPWGHSDTESNTYQGDFMENGDSISLKGAYLRWLNYWLKGEDNGVMNEPLVQLYVLNSSHWHHDSVYTQGALFNLFLNSSGNEGKRIDNPAELNFSMAKELSPAFDSFTYNPAHTTKFDESMLSRRNGEALQKMLTGRNDYVIYTTDALKEDKILSGEASVKFYASSTTKDTDWFAILLSLDSNNNINGTIGMTALRARFRNGFDKLELLSVDSVHEYDLKFSHPATKIAEGQRIGLIITSSWNYPLYGKNLNTGQNNQTTERSEIAGQRIHHSLKYPSRIVLRLLQTSR